MLQDNMVMIERNYQIMEHNYKKNKKLDSCMVLMKNNSKKYLKMLVKLKVRASIPAKTTMAPNQKYGVNIGFPPPSKKVGKKLSLYTVYQSWGENTIFPPGIYWPQPQKQEKIPGLKKAGDFR